jgi:thiosulfate reductase cytochrome b subunit
MQGQGDRLLESSHAVSGLSGLGLLTLQSLLPVAFNSPGNGQALRSVHALLGTGILGLFSVHLVLGLQLAFSIPS